MVYKPIKPQELPYGFTNPNLVGRGGIGGWQDPRTMSSDKLFREYMAKGMQKSVAENSTPGIIMDWKRVPVPRPGDQDAVLQKMVNPGSGDPEMERIVYTVLVFEYECSPWTTQCKGWALPDDVGQPGKQTEQSKFNNTISEMGIPLSPALQVSNWWGMGTTEMPIDPGTWVIVKYDNIQTGTNPLIVEIGGSAEGTLEWNDKNARDTFESGGAGPGAGPSPPVSSANESSSSSNSGLNRAERRARQFDELIEARRETFESDGYTVAENADLNDSGGILSAGDQVRLKALNAAKHAEVCSSLNIGNEDLYNLFKLESGKFDPYAINRHSNATGLIQWTPATAEGLGTSVESILRMSPDEQYDLVERYFESQTGTGQVYYEDLLDIYLVVFYPRARRENDSFVLGSEVSQQRAEAIADQNRTYRDISLRGHPQHLVTKGKIRARLTQRLGAAAM